MNHIQRIAAILAKGTQPDGSSFITSQARTASNNIMLAKTVNGALVPYADLKSEYIKRGYQNNDLVYMIVKAIVDKATVAPWALYKIVDDDAYQKSLILGKKLGEGLNKNTDKNLREYRTLRKKALQPVVGDKAIEKLLKQPSKGVTLSKHHATLWSYKLTTGDYYEQWISPSGGLRRGMPIEWRALPSHFMTIRTNQAWPVTLMGYTLLAGVNQDFEADEVLHECYPNLDWSIDGQHLYGLSPIKPGAKRLQRNNESQNNGSKLMKNGGQRGIVYIKMPAEALKDDFNGDMTLDQINEMKIRYDEVLKSGEPGETAFSGYETGFTPIGLSPVDLDQVNMESHDFRMMCGWYRFPSQLLGDPESKTYNNMQEAGKAMILSCVLPLLTDREQSLAMQLENIPAYADGKYVIAADIAVYDELATNRKDQVSYLAQADWLTRNEKRIEMDYDPLNIPEMDLIYVSSDEIPIDETRTLVDEETDTTNEDTTNEDNIDYGT